jgi:hypothetical protein
MQKLESLSDPQLYKRCQEYGLNARVWLRRFAGLLPEVYRRKLYKKKGYISIHEFAGKLAGMSHDAIDKVLRLSERLKDKPRLYSMLESGENGWSKLEAVSYIATQETDKFWSQKVEALNKSSLVEYVRQYRLKSAAGGDSKNEEAILQPWNTIPVKLSPENEKRLRKFKQTFEKNKKQILSWNEMLGSMMDKFEAREGLIQKKVKVEICPECAQRRCNKDEKNKKVTRHIPADAKKIVLSRGNGTCEYPECLRPGEIFHHVRRFAAKKNHDPQFIRHLCKKHEGILQASLIDNETKEPTEWNILEEAEKHTLEFYIDEKVAEFRREPKKISTSGLDPKASHQNLGQEVDGYQRHIQHLG